MMNKPAFRKMLLPIAIAASLTACGGGSSGGGGSTPSNVEGSTSKGIIAGGIVNAYGISDTGEINRETPLAEPATTAEDGSYTLSLNDNYVAGTPVYVEITATDGTTMKCDLVQCGTDAEDNPIVFGDSYPLASNFAMSALLPKAEGESVAVNITPLTAVASKLALQRVVSGAKPADAALAANAQVANRLGITGGLIQQAIVDITNAEAVNSADKAALEYNLKAAAAIAATLKDNIELSLEDAVAGFATQFVDGGGLADREAVASSAVSIEELLTEALAVLDAVKAQEGVDAQSQGLSQSSSSVAAAKASATASPNTEVSQGEVPDDIGSEGLLAAKAFVQQIRNLATAGVITENQQAFAEDIDLAAAAMSAESNVVAEGLGLGLEAIASAFTAYQDAPDDDKPASFTSDAGVDVDITSSGDNLNFEVDQDLTVGETVVAVALSAGGKLINEFNESEEIVGNTSISELNGIIDVDLTVQGSAASEAVSLSIDEGSSLVGTMEFDETRTDVTTENSFGDEIDDHLTVTGLEAALSVTLSQLGGDNPVAFNGSMGLAIDLINIDREGSYSEEFDETGFSNSEQDTEITSIDGLDLTLSGEFTDSDGRSLLASLSASLDNLQETCVLDSSSDSQLGGQFSYECDTNETAENFAAASLAIVFEVSLAGIDDDINVNFTASRTGLDSGEGSIQLSYNGMQLNLAYEGGDSVTLSNQNNVVLTLTEAEDDSISGAITQNDIEYATVSDESGAIIVRYTDGSFESAM